MNVSRRWLEAFLQRPLTSAELVPKLAMLGAPADAVIALGADLKTIVIGLVETVRQHPNADRLRICSVNDGTPTRRQVVTGAPNVEAGKRYPFAAVGVTLPGGLKLEKKKLRGELSEGMLCSARELGLGEEHDGLMTLDTEADPGTPLPQVLGVDDEQLVLDIAPVRPDLLGHKGIARELAAVLKVPFRLPAVPGIERVQAPPVTRSADAIRANGLTVAIAAGAGCARFAAAVIRGVKVGPSPEWLVQRLEAVGVRSINNVVDATNYTMFELGQPFHAYDLATLSGGHLEARLVRAGEKLVTLDGAERTLDPSLTVIADANGPVGVAGVMGGQATEVREQTETIALECAWFDPRAIRRARKALGLTSEATQRFERGTDLWGIPDALRRCAEIIVAVAGGTIDDPMVDVWPSPSNPPRIFLRTSRVAQVLGVELPVHVIEQCLVAIGATVVAKPAEERLAVDVPGWRPDLVAEIDLIEEIARIHGYDTLPDQLRPFRPGHATDAPIEIAARAVRVGMAAQGLYEVISLPIGPEDGPGMVPVLNPLSADHGFLRSSLLPGLTRHVEANWANQVRDVRLFEIGTVFEPNPSSQEGRPRETMMLGAVITGAREPAHWTTGQAAPQYDVWDLKGLFEQAILLANPKARIQVEGDGWIALGPEGQPIGTARPLSADAPPWAGPLFGLEVVMEPSQGRPGAYVPIPAVPASTRDLALLLPPALHAATVQAALRQAAGGLLESIEVIDEYRGPGLPADRRSVAFRLTFRSRERTLRDAEVDGTLARVVSTLEKTLDVAVRSS